MELSFWYFTDNNLPKYWPEESDSCLIFFFFFPQNSGANRLIFTLNLPDILSFGNPNLEMFFKINVLKLHGIVFQ